MSENTNTQKTTTVSPVTPQEVQGGQFRFETWWIIGFLIFALFLLKTFIYTKDAKRDGK